MRPMRDGLALVRRRGRVARNKPRSQPFIIRLVSLSLPPPMPELSYET